VPTCNPSLEADQDPYSSIGTGTVPLCNTQPFSRGGSGSLFIYWDRYCTTVQHATLLQRRIRIPTHPLGQVLYHCATCNPSPEADQAPYSSIGTGTVPLCNMQPFSRGGSGTLYIYWDRYCTTVQHATLFSKGIRLPIHLFGQVPLCNILPFSIGGSGSLLIY
jgi:hypothetical protein